MLSGVRPELADLAKSTAGILAELGEEYDARCEAYVLNLAGTITGGHFNEEAARIVIGRMIPTELVGPEGKMFSGTMWEYLSMLGVTPESALRAVSEAHERLCELARVNGLLPLPPLPTDITDWDCLVLIARALSDYWSISLGDLRIASEVAVSDLIDRDSTWEKKWRFLTA
jgi:hypothetical protein